MPDDTIRMVEAEQAQAALNRFLRPAFDVARADYVAKLAEVAARPLGSAERAAIEKLALAIKVVDQVRLQIEGIVTDGKVAAGERAHSAKIMAISPERRKMMGITI